MFRQLHSRHRQQCRQRSRDRTVGPSDGYPIAPHVSRQRRIRIRPRETRKKIHHTFIAPWAASRPSQSRRLYYGLLSPSSLIRSLSDARRRTPTQSAQHQGRQLSCRWSQNNVTLLRRKQYTECTSPAAEQPLRTPKTLASMRNRVTPEETTQDLQVSTERPSARRQRKSPMISAASHAVASSLQHDNTHFSSVFSVRENDQQVQCKLHASHRDRINRRYGSLDLFGHTTTMP